MKINVEKRTSKAKKVDLVTFKDMENYMNLFPEEKKAILLKQYKRVKACSKTHSSPYKFVLDWFEDYFPLYHETPEFDENGDLTDWKAFCYSAGMSAQVYLKDPSDKAIYDKTYNLLKHMRDEGIYGISEVWTTEEINELEHLSGDFSFVIETDGYTSFANEWTRPMIKQFDLSDYRFGHATHGYLPDKGPQPTFIGFGPDIKVGVEIERRPTVDEAPTYAKILGCEMPWADGTAIVEMLK